MAVALYMDHNVPRAITIGLRLRGVDALTAYEDGTHECNDVLLLNRAFELGRVLFTQDDDLLAEAVKRQRNNTPFAGVIYARQACVSIGVCIRNLETIARYAEPEDLKNHVVFLPL